MRKVSRKMLEKKREQSGTGMKEEFKWKSQLQIACHLLLFSSCSNFGPDLMQSSEKNTIEHERREVEMKKGARGENRVKEMEITR